MRWMRLEHDFTQLGVGSADVRADWLALYGAIHMNAHLNMRHVFPVIRELQITGEFSAGPVLGSGGGFSATIGAEGRAWLTDNLSIDFGYHFVSLSAEHDDYEIDSSLKGLFVGASLRW